MSMIFFWSFLNSALVSSHVVENIISYQTSSVLWDFCLLHRYGEPCNDVKCIIILTTAEPMIKLWKNSILTHRTKSFKYKRPFPKHREVCGKYMYSTQQGIWDELWGVWKQISNTVLSTRFWYIYRLNQNLKEKMEKWNHKMFC